MRQIIFPLVLALIFSPNSFGQRILRIATTRPCDNGLLQRNLSPVMREQLLLERFAAANNMRLSFRQVADLKALFELLERGEVDIIFGNLSITAQRKRKMAFSLPVGKTKVSVVTSRKIRGGGIRMLRDKLIFVERNSSYINNLLELRKQVKSLKITEAPPKWDTEELLYMTGAGKILFAVADDNFISAYQQYRPDIKVVYTFPRSEYSAFAMRKSALRLLTAVNQFLRKHLAEYVAAPVNNDWRSIRRRGFIRVLTRNNPYTYFIHRGRLMGFEYELAKRFAQKHKLKLIMIVPPSWSAMFEWLKQGRGDFIAAAMTITDKRLTMPGLTLCHPYCRIFEQVISRKKQPPFKSVSDLAGKEIAVRYGSSYYASLKKLQATGIAVKIIPLPPTVGTDEALQLTAAGKYQYTMADSNIFQSERHCHPKLHSVLSLPKPQAYGWMTRSGNRQLRDAIDRFFKKEDKSVFFNLVYRKYFSPDSTPAQLQAGKNLRRPEISKFDPLIKKNAGHYAFPWCLIAAQIYQESRFNPNAKAWDGGMGLMQLMPDTAKELGCRKPFAPADNIQAGTKYMHRLRKYFKQGVSDSDKIRFALASYNGGYGHVIDARKLAAEQGLDPNRWNGNVEEAMKLLAKKKYAAKARYGSCRSDIIVNYVNNIFIRYYHYKQKVNEK